MCHIGFSVLGLPFCHATKTSGLPTRHPDTLFLQSNSICGACSWAPKNDPSESFLEKHQDAKPRSLGPRSGGVWLSQMRCHQQGTQTIGTWREAEQRGWQQTLSSGKYMRALGAGGRVHVPLRSLRNCTLTAIGVIFSKQKVLSYPRTSNYVPAKASSAPCAELGDASEGSPSWQEVRRDPWRAIPDGLLGLRPTLSIGGGGHGQAKVLPSCPRMSAHGRKPHAICQRQLGEAPVNVLPSERSFCSPFKVSPHLEWCL